MVERNIQNLFEFTNLTISYNDKFLKKAEQLEKNMSINPSEN